MSLHGSDSTVAAAPHPASSSDVPSSTPPLSSSIRPTSASAVPLHVRYASDSDMTAASASSPDANANGRGGPSSSSARRRPSLFLEATDPTVVGRPRSASDVPTRGANVFSPTSPSGLRRRLSRAPTFRNVDNFAEFSLRPGWRPGAEPGIDTSKPDGGGHETLAHLQAPSDINVVDFSHDDMVTTRLDNATLAGFLAQPQMEGAKCRWINVNGLSWDVIQTLGNHKGLHRLAIEDLLNTRNRTKADWYPTHTFIVLTLQKLVHVDKTQSRANDTYYEGDGQDDDHGGGASGRGRRGTASFLRNVLRRKTRNADGGRGPNAAAAISSKALESGQQPGAPQSPPPPPPPPQTRSGYWPSPTAAPSVSPDYAHVNRFRTLQRYHASPFDARTEFMESHSALNSRGLAVAAEQVSIFITSDNTVISFFQLSAQDIEQPILKRLRLPDTSLRRSCDASMVAQAILDAIIDLAIPVAVCYGDVIADLELDVLTRPSVTHTKSLYITITEVNKVLSFITPVMNLINTLRDHKTDNVAVDDLQNPSKGVIISPMTYVYFADVLDHCVLLTESLEQIRGQAENMISLIFNTISAYQNESMKQLTIVTIIFLPLTFLTGYFGQNFDNFSALRSGIPFFWEIAGPVIFFTIVIMMREMISDYIKSLIQRRHIFNIRRLRRKHQDKVNKARR
ncbi:Mg2+ transporter protein [Niveomyces insectorum RCEF 264]|uniref:Mg2+ transporter protein n=1 Tax=Niveomyces insectorum RCEF 264 TaxID=1081102 RepID=A0A167UU78_9HYPO|nr:Mg2+ transporter protein [Niveomyces insectorum RCEF 264]